MTDKPYPTRRELREAERARQIAQQNEKQAGEPTAEVGVPTEPNRAHALAQQQASAENITSKVVEEAPAAETEPRTASARDTTDAEAPRDAVVDTDANVDINADADMPGQSVGEPVAVSRRARRAHRHAQHDENQDDEASATGDVTPAADTSSNDEAPKTALLAAQDMPETAEHDEVMPAHSDSGTGTDDEENSTSSQHKGFWGRFRNRNGASEQDAAKEDDAEHNVDEQRVAGQVTDLASNDGARDKSAAHTAPPEPADLPLVSDDGPLIGGSLLGSEAIVRSDADSTATDDVDLIHESLSDQTPEVDTSEHDTPEHTDDATSLLPEIHATSDKSDKSDKSESAGAQAAHHLRSRMPQSIGASVITDAPEAPTNLTLPPKSKGHTLAAPINQTGEVILSTGTVTIPSSMSQTGRIDLHLDSTVPTTGRDLGDVASTEHRPVSAKDAFAGFDSKSVLPKQSGTSNGLTIALAIVAGVLLIAAAALLTAYLIIRNG